ncbi:MAG: hypothetical protein HHJ13_16865, partial [Phycicoccus sp.]|nr:hypothetical protein [Phycicoccus sp.]
MSLVVALLVAVGVLFWPDHSGARRLAILPRLTSTAALVPSSWTVSVWERGLRWRRGLDAEQVSPQDLLSLLDAISPALEAGVVPASALRIAADSRSGSGRADPQAARAKDMASAAADGAPRGPQGRAAA